ncbi:hypothetical protein [uncultured Algoriphagus sp.]|uniref:hypothetical protein n=1 Tax=uncultured Algoriphagus sp. TaxID=417365 RepID=UPI0030ED7652|tara:strand:+ start:5081 stop:5551 length:471 start_codon:yes stop_codon:yes gene_type:complete
MKLSITYSLVFSILLFSSACNNSKDSDPIIPDDTSGIPGSVKVTGEVEILKTGTFTSQSGSNTKGMIDLVTDESGSYFIKLGSDFTSSFHTGTVNVYLSSSKDLTLSEKESFQLVAVVNEPGEHYFKLANFPDSKFSHGILWCGAAAIPFGFAELK